MLRQTLLKDLERLLEIYQEDIGPRAAVVPEVQRWVNKWKKEDVSTVRQVPLLPAVIADLISCFSIYKICEGLFY